MKITKGIKKLMENVIQFIKTLPEIQQQQWWFFLKIMSNQHPENTEYETLLDLYADSNEDLSEIDLSGSEKI